MNRGSQLTAPNGYRNLKMGRTYHLLDSQASRVLLIEFQEKIGKKKKRCGKNGKYKAVSRTWSSVLEIMPREQFETGLQLEQIVLAEPQVEFPPWLPHGAPAIDLNIDTDKNRSPKISHSKRIERKKSAIAALVERRQEILNTRNPDKCINRHAASCVPQQHPGRVRLWFYTYLLFGTDDCLHYPTSNIGHYDRNQDGAKRGRPSLSGYVGYNATCLESLMVDGYLQHSDLGKDMTEIHRDVAIEVFGCETRPGQIPGSLELYHPEGNPFPTVYQFRYFIKKHLGEVQVKEDKRGPRFMREEFLPSQGSYAQDVMNLMSQVQADGYFCEDLPKGLISDGPLPPMCVVRQLCVASGELTGIGFSLGSETGVAYRMAKFCAAIPKDVWGEIFGMKIDRDRWPSIGVAAEDVIDRGAGATAQADAQGGDVVSMKPMKSLVPAGQPLSKAAIESSNPKKSKDREGPHYYVSKLGPFGMARREIERLMKENESKNIASHVPPDLLKDIPLMNPNSLWKALDRRGRNSAITIPFETAVRLFLPKTKGFVRGDGIYVHGQRYDSPVFQAVRPFTVARSQKQIEVTVYHVVVAMRYIWAEVAGQLVQLEIQYPLGTRTDQKYISLAELEQRAELIAKNNSAMRLNRSAREVEAERRIRESAGVGSSAPTRVKGRRRRKRQGAVPRGMRGQHR